MDNSSFNGQAPSVQSGGDHRNHPDTEKVRRFMQKNIYDYLILKAQQHSSDISAQRLIDLTRLVDKALFNAASTLDEYMNMHTLENRLLFYLRQLRDGQRQRLLQMQQQQVNSGLANQDQQFVQHGDSSGNLSTMIPTPGSLLPHTCGMGGASSFSSGYQQPAPVSPNSSGSNNMLSSMVGGDERILSQMMHDYCQLKEDNS